MSIKPFILVTECEVVYEGRASSTLERGTYLVMYKPDKSITVHGARARPLNYQNPKSEVVIYRDGDEFDAIWRAYFKEQPQFLIWSMNKEETLTIAVYGINKEFADLSYHKICLLRSESDLVSQIVANIDDYLPAVDLMVLETEVQTPYGAVDILIEDAANVLHVAEVKRKLAGVAACSQVRRYGDHYREMGRTVLEYLMAPAISRNAATYAAEHGLTYVEVEFNRRPGVTNE